MHFEYYRSTQEEFSSSRLWGGLVLYALFAIFTYVYIKTGNKIILFLLPIIIIVILLHLFRLRKLRKSPGRWEIYITDNEVVWRTPKEFESGFVISISEISKYIEVSSSLNEYVSHYLELKNGTKLLLNPNVSNFNFALFSKALMNLGIECEARTEN